MLFYIISSIIFSGLCYIHYKRENIVNGLQSLNKIQLMFFDCCVIDYGKRLRLQNKKSK